MVMDFLRTHSLSRDVMEPKLWARQFFAGANTLAGEPFSVHPGFLPEFRH